LGNPGEKYKKTRHNAGFSVIERISEKLDIKLKKPAFKRFKIAKIRLNENNIFLVKPLTFMNCSGEILHDLLKYTKAVISDIIVVCDTLDLSPGKLRLKRNGSGAGQKGLESIIRIAGTDNFVRMFIGIGRPQSRDNVINYVLKRPSREDSELISQAVERASESLLKLAESPIESIMNEIN
jgi:peptidyl-tRNA hydrolase, PTH1 family